jgi:DNA-binding CsgD family transcriptional regulator
VDEKTDIGASEGALLERLGAAARPACEAPPTEEQIDDMLGAVAAIETALDAISAPAFVVGESGAVLLASSSARALAADELAHVHRSLVALAATGAGEGAWEVRPFSRPRASMSFLAVLRTPLPGGKEERLLERARAGWGLTGRQAEVLGLVLRGFTNALIADTLGIGTSTVEFHVKTLFDKAGVCNRATLLARVRGLEGT